MALEAVLLLPLMIALTLTAIFIAEHMMFRADVAVEVRTATLSVAGEGVCAGQDDTYSARLGTVRSLEVHCGQRDEENDLRTLLPIMDDLEQAAHVWPGFLRDIAPTAPYLAAIGIGAGSQSLDQPPFLRNFAQTETEKNYRNSEKDFWPHVHSRWRRAYDPIIWEELSKRGTYLLFPNVFPAAIGGTISSLPAKGE